MTIARGAAATLALAVPILIAPVVGRVRAAPRAKRVLEAVVSATPLAAPPVLGWRRLGGVLASVYCVIAFLKLIAYFRRRVPEASPLRTWLFLAAWPALEPERVLARLPGPRGPRVARRGFLGIAHLAPGFGLLMLGAAIGLPGRSMLLDRLLVAVEIYALAVGANHLLVAAFAAAGFDVDDAFRYPVLARSVLDFWSRYDVWIHRWLKRHVYRTIGARRPLAATLAVFAVSGVLHEYLFLASAPEVLGRQLAFFMLHGVGGLAGAYAGRGYRGRFGRRVPRALGVPATLAFVLATSFLFVSCLDPLASAHGQVGAWLVRLAVHPGQDPGR